MARVETFGGSFPAEIVEAVRQPGSQTLLLHLRRGRKFATARKFTREKRIFIPPVLGGGLVAAVRFPPPSVSFGSVHELTWSMREFLAEHANLPDEGACLLVAFAIATWFCDVVDMAPVLHVFGPEREVSHCLRLLSCLCRRSVLLGHANLASLGTLPRGLAATLIFNQRDLGKRLSQVLVASNRRQFCIAHSSRCTDLYGAKIFACDESIPNQHGLKLSLVSQREPHPLFSDAEQEENARSFQARLLRFRFLYLEAVRSRRVDCGPFHPELRDQAHCWLSPIDNCNELKTSVAGELQRRGNELAAARYTDRHCVIIEAALHFCHREATDKVYVGDVADAANALLEGRHEKPIFTDRGAGAILRKMGIETDQRDAKGFWLDLTEPLRKRIHYVAASYRVLSMDGTTRCRYCPGQVQGSENPNL